MTNLSREAAALQEILKVREDLRLHLQDLLASQAKLDAFWQALRLAERETRSIGLRQSVVASATDQHDPNHIVTLQGEANVAFRALRDALSTVPDQIDTVKTMVSEIDEVITVLHLSFNQAYLAHA